MSRIYTAEDFQDAAVCRQEKASENVKPRSYWARVWQEFRKNKIALFSMVILGIMIFMCLFGPMMNRYDSITNDYSCVNQKPDTEHWFGTDTLGRDLWNRVWCGGRISLLIAVAATLIPKFFGMLVGGVSGYFGGTVDTVIMRTIDILMGIPNMVYIVLFSIALGSGSVISMIVVISLTGWMGSARMTRGLVKQIRERDYVLASESLGVSPMKVILRHLIPNTLGITLVSTVMSIPGAIYMEATLSYIGLGVLPPVATWGELINDAISQLRYYPYQFVIPCLMLTLTMLCCHLMADGLRDALNPKSTT